VFKGVVLNACALRIAEAFKAIATAAIPIIRFMVVAPVVERSGRSFVPPTVLVATRSPNPRLAAVPQGTNLPYSAALSPREQPPFSARLRAAAGRRSCKLDR
jgi:hypothetical protein